MLEFRRFIAKHDLTSFQMNPHFPVNSLLAMRIITAVDGEDAFMAVTDAMMAAMWEQGIDLSQREAAIAA